MIPEKAVKMIPEIIDDPSYSSTCDGREMVIDDRREGKREGGRIGEEDDCGRTEEAQENMNTKG